ncbi:MAG TPA: hypothetical protein VKV24_15795 [Casimicrobiaceae bacterium]|nr:hypothetical protein [Casimicrobiaceae bacterium]
MKHRRRELIKLLAAAGAMPASTRLFAAAPGIERHGSLPLERKGFCVDIAALQGADASITDYSGFGYCPAVDSMLLFGGGHAATPEDVVARFAMSSLAWSADYPATPKATMLMPTSGTALDMTSSYPGIKPGDAGWPRYLTSGRFWRVPGEKPELRPVSRHTYSGFIWSQAVKRMVLPMGNNGICYGFPNSTTGGNVGFYDPVAREWEDTGVAGGPPASAWCEDPVSGVLLGHYEGAFVVYDPRVRKFIRNTQLNAIPYFGYGGNLVYFPPQDKFYYFGRNVDPATGHNHVWEYALDRTAWSPRYTKPAANSQYGSPMDTNAHPMPPTGDTRFVYDAANKLIVGGICQNLVCAFKPLGNNAGEWYQQDAPGIAATIFYCHHYAPTQDAHFTLAHVASGVRTFAFRWDSAKAVKCGGTAPAVVPGSSSSSVKADGIARDVAHDLDLARHPDVIGYVDFSSIARVNADLGRSNVWMPGRPWYANTRQPDGSNFCVANPEFSTEHGLHFMRFEGTQRLIAAYLWAGKGVRHAFARYVLVIEPDVPQYMTELGVKLPGLAGAYEDTIIHPPHAGKVTFSWRMEHGPKDRLSVRDYLYDGASGGGYGDIRDYGVLFPVGVPVVVEQELDVDKQQGRIWIDGVHVGERRVVTDVDIEMLFINVYHGGMGFATRPIHYRLAAACLARSYIGPPKELLAALQASPLTVPASSAQTTSAPNEPGPDWVPTSPYIRDNPRFGIRK